MYDVYLSLQNPADLTSLGDMNSFASSGKSTLTPEQAREEDSAIPPGADRYEFVRWLVYQRLAPLGIKMGPTTSPDAKETIYRPNNLWEFINTEDFVRDAKAAGYDGVVVREAGKKTWGAFEQGQIKLVSNKRPNRANPDIRFSIPDRIAMELDAAANDLMDLDTDCQAREADQRWKDARRDAERRGRALAVCQQPAPQRDPEPARAVADRGLGAAEPAAAVAADPGAGDRGAGVRLTWEFVRLYDTAWTDAGGEPVHGAQAGPAGAADPGAASPYGIADVLDVHAENARLCSEDRREHRALIERITAEEIAFDKANR